MKRNRLSGCAYKKRREKRRLEDESSANILEGFLQKRAKTTESIGTGEQSSCSTLTEASETTDFVITGAEERPDDPSSVQDQMTVSHPSSSNCVKTVYNRVFYDAGTWVMPVSDDLRVELVERGPHGLQNMDVSFPSNTENRSMSRDWFFKILPNGERMRRSWIVYSPTKNAVYCFCCRLFNRNQSSFGSDEGFSKWRKLNPRVSEHENSPSHSTAFSHWKELTIRLKRGATLDNEIETLVMAEKSVWKEILKRLCDCVMFLAKQNLPFRGHRESLTEGNSGNFLELVKFLGQYDPVIREHLTRIQNSEKKSITYLSPEIQNEFIDVLGRCVRTSILGEIKKAKYFAIMFDSTPDTSHVDQLSEVIRYVHISNGQVRVKEAFIDFMPLEGKTAAAIAEVILKKLEKDGLSLEDCYGQGYDNAATMAGIHSGLQRRILNLNPKAVFIPCNNHCLNLAGVHSVGVTPNATTFFGVVESLYVFFSSSTHRWDVLKLHVNLHVKQTASTRWSSKYDAVHAIESNFENMLNALEDLNDRTTETLDTRGAAGALVASMMSYSFVSYLYFWSVVLKEVNDTQIYLQTKGIGLDMCAAKMASLSQFLKEERERIVLEAETKTAQVCEQLSISIERRIRRKNRMPGEKCRDKGLSLQEEIRKELFEAVDRLKSEIDTRSEQMNVQNKRFGFLKPSVIFDEGNDNDINEGVDDLCNAYDELNSDELKKEIRRLRQHMTSYRNMCGELESYREWSFFQLLAWIVEWDYTERLINLVIALRIFHTMCVSIASCERSFSKLKLIKTYLRSTMNQSRLTNLSILSIEKDTADKLDFEDVISDFASLKVRKCR